MYKRLEGEDKSEKDQKEEENEQAAKQKTTELLRLERTSQNSIVMLATDVCIN